jgi:AraC-like DNA-binding protein
MGTSALTLPNVSLGQVVGTYHERSPPRSLQLHFACTWFNRIGAGSPRAAAIVPDGCMDLQWIDGRLRIAGPDRIAKIEHLSEGATVIGLRFQPGAATAWLRAPASALVDERVPLEAFWGSEASTLAEWVGEARSAEGIARRLERALERKAVAVGPPDAIAPAIHRLIQSNRQAEVIPSLRDRLGLSERTVRRVCRKAFGYGPKRLERILRFQRFLRLGRDAQSLGLAGLALAAGYADQAHLTRETAELAGLTPRAILAQLGG